MKQVLTELEKFHKRNKELVELKQEYSIELDYLLINDDKNKRIIELKQHIININSALMIKLRG